MPVTSSRLAVWGVRIVALVALFGGIQLVVPSVDRTAIQLLLAKSDHPSILTLLPVSVFAVGITPLLLVSLGAAVFRGAELAASTRGRRWEVAGFLAWCVFVGVSTAMKLYSVGRTSSDVDLSPVLLRDGGYEVMALPVLSLIAGGAVLWFLTEWVTARGEVSGPVLLAAALALARDLELFVRAWERSDDGVPMTILLIRVLPWIVVLVALWHSGVSAWPVRMVGGLQLRSPLDALLLPVALTYLSDAFAGLVLVLVSVSGVVVALHRARGQARGSMLLLVAVPLILVPTVALVLLPVARRVWAAAQAGPLAGSLNAAVELACADADSSTSAADARVMETRLSRARVKGRVVVDRPGHLRLEVEKISNAEDAIAAVTPRYHLRFMRVALDQGAVSPDTLDWQAAGLSVESDYDGRSIVGSQPESFGALLRDLPQLEGREILLECRPRQRGFGCALKVLETGEVLEGTRLRDVEVERDKSGQASLRLQFDARGSAELEHLTQEPGRDVAIVLDDQILSAPKVMTPILGGSAVITLGRAQGDPKSIREAQRIADGLLSKPLTCAWKPVSVVIRP